LLNHNASAGGQQRSRMVALAWPTRRNRVDGLDDRGAAHRSAIDAEGFPGYKAADSGRPSGLLYRQGLPASAGEDYRLRVVYGAG